jgi:hypothetical protein
MCNMATRYLTMTEAAEHIGISIRQLHNIRAQGGIAWEQAKTPGSRGRPSVRITWSEAERVRLERTRFEQVKATTRKTT